MGSTGMLTVSESVWNGDPKYVRLKYVIIPFWSISVGGLKQTLIETDVILNPDTFWGGSVGAN